MELKGYLSILKQRFLWVLAGFLLVLGAYFGVLQMRGVEYSSNATMLIQAVPHFRYEILDVKPVRLTETTVYEYLQKDDWMRAAAKVKRAAQLEGKDPRSFVDQRFTMEDIDKVLRKHKDPLLTDPNKLDREANYLDSSLDHRQTSKMSQLYRVEGTGPTRGEAKLIVNSYVAASAIKGKEVAEMSFNTLRERLEENKRELESEIGDRDAQNHDSSEDDGGDTLMDRYYKIIHRTDPSANRIEDIRDTMNGYRQELNNIRPRITQMKISLLQNQKFRELTMQALSQKKSIGTIPLTSGFTKGDLTNKLRGEIRNLKMEIAGGLDSRTSNHPAVREKRARLEFLRQQLPSVKSNELKRALGRFISNKRELQVKMEGYSQRMETLNQKIAELSEPLAKLENIRAKVEEREKLINVINEDLQKLEKVQTVQKLVQADSWAESTTAVAEEAAVTPWAALALAFLVGIGLAYFRDYLDTTIRTDYDVRRYLNLPIFALVREEEDEDMVLIKEHPVKAPVSEIFNTASTLLHSAMQEGGLKSISLTSSVSKEGKTTMTINLGTAFGRKGLDTVLVDMDLRGPRLHKRLDLDNTRGVATFLKEQIDNQTPEEAYPDVLNRSVLDLCQQSEVENLKVIPSGPGPEKPVRLLESPYLPGFMDFLQEEFDVVLVDTPPVKSVGDSLTVAREVDGTLLIIGSGMVTKQDANWAKHLLTNVHAHLLGVVINRYKRDKGVEYYYYNSYYEKDYRYGV